MTEQLGKPPVARGRTAPATGAPATGAPTGAPTGGAPTEAVSTGPRQQAATAGASQQGPQSQTGTALNPMAAIGRVLPTGPIPVALGAGALALAGVVEWPVAGAIGLGYLAARYWRSAPAEPAQHESSAQP